MFAPSGGAAAGARWARARAEVMKGPPGSSEPGGHVRRQASSLRGFPKVHDEQP